MDAVFSFEDVEEVSSPARTVTTPFPGAPSSFYPRAGTLFGGSPRPVASGATVGVKKEETKVSLLHVGDPAEVCGGVIGSPDNEKFCAARPGDCAFQLTHLNKKFELGTDSLCVMSPKKGSIHATLFPRLPRNCIPNDKALEDLLNDERSVPMWHVHFDECKAAEEATGDNELGSGPGVSWEDADRPSLDFLERANDFHTPRKVKVSSLYDASSELMKLENVIALDLEDIPSSSEVDQSEVQKTLRQMVVGWKVISSDFLALGRWTNDKDVDEGVVRTQLKNLSDCMNDIGAKTRLLSAKIGQNPRAKEEGEPALWSALAELNTDLKTMELALKKLPSSLKEVRDSLEKHENGMVHMESNLTSMCTHHKSHLTSSNKRLMSLEKRSSGQLHAPRAQPQEGVFNFEPASNEAGGDGVQKVIQEMRAEIAELRQSTVHQGSVTGNPMFPVNSLAEIMSRLKAVETRVTAAESCAIGGTTFSSEGQVGNYITTHSAPSCAMCWDLFSIMVCMGAQGASGKERADKIYSAERGRTGSALEGDLVASMTHKRPLCLFGEGSKLARLDQGFAMCKTCDHWIGAGDNVSYRDELTTQIRSYTEGIMGQVGDAETPASLLAHFLLSLNTMQWTAISGFMDMFYLDLVAKCKFDPGKAWKLVAVCVASIFKATQPFRTKVILLEDSTKLGQKAAFMWATFQTHRIIDSFVSVNFQSHPFIVTEISLFMVRERVDAKEVADLGAKCKKAEESSNKASAEVKRLSEAHNDLKRKHGALHAEFRLVKGKVK